MDRSRLLDSGTVLVTDSLPPWWAPKISSSVRAVAAELSVAVIASMDTSLSPGACRGRTAHGTGTRQRAQHGKVVRQETQGWRVRGNAGDVSALPLLCLHGRQPGTARMAPLDSRGV